MTLACTTLSLIVHIYFCAFNFCISQAIRKYFDNEIFVIYVQYSFFKNHILHQRPIVA